MNPLNKNDLPIEKGTYALYLKSESSKRISIGRFGEMQLEKGFYVYVGSAFGPGGIRARLGRHLGEEKTLRWHIDYLRQYTQPVAIRLDIGKRSEHRWAKQLEKNHHTQIPLKGFGASDCQCASHLFFSHQLNEIYPLS